MYSNVTVCCRQAYGMQCFLMRSSMHGHQQPAVPDTGSSVRRFHRLGCGMAPVALTQDLHHVPELCMLR